jgi:hypothetical protein
MKSTALCLIVLIAVSQAASLFEKYPINFSKKRSFLTLLTQVEAKLASGGPLDTITKMLNDFKTQITEEQVQHDNLYKQQQQECSTETDFRQKEIDDAVGAFKSASETLDGCTSQAVRAEGDLSLTKKQLGESRQYLVIIEDQRQREAYNFDTQKNVYETYKKTIEELLIMVEEFFAGEGNFL